MQITEQSTACQQDFNVPPAYWAKLTTFDSGAFEFAVSLPKTMSHHRDNSAYSTRFGAVMSQREQEKTELSEEQKKAANLARSVRRSRQKVRHTIKAIKADHMLTLTYRENMQDIDKLKSDFAKFRRMMVARFPLWQYCAVRETQERGALHLHIAVKGRQPLNYIRTCWYIAIGGSASDKGDKTLGAINVRAPSRFSGRQGKSVKWKVEKLAGYLTKYLGKEFEGTDTHHTARYWLSKGIEGIEVTKFWLGATNFRDAIVECHNLVHGRGASNLSIWAADDWQNIWISGNDLCPF
jgi:hypothetical protein